jgi:beta-xylosidase
MAVELWHDTTRSVTERAEALLAELTTTEKAAQLGSHWARQTRTSVGGEVAPMESVFAASTLDEVAAHGLGHLTRIFGTEPVEVAEGVDRVRAAQRRVVELNRLGVPAIVHEECLTGFTTYHATVYPAAIAWGATFDPQLIEEMAEAIGEDLRSVGVHQGLSPLLDVVRDYRWGRVEETIGEDPYVVGTIGTAYVQGLQRAGISATLKHFVGYSASRAARNHAPVPMGRRELEDVMLPSFEMAVRLGGVESVMNSYSDIDNVPVAASHDLLTHVLRERWGFTGTVVSDYGAIGFLHLMHHVAADLPEAGRLALSAGLDIELPQTAAYRTLADDVAKGRLDEAVLDRAVQRVLEQKIRHGLLDPDWDPEAQGDPARDLDSPRNRDIARRVAEGSVALLANDGILPLAALTIALVGPIAGEPRSFMGCYAFPNHVLNRFGNGGIGLEVASLAEGLAAELPGSRVVSAPGVPFLAEDRSQLEAAVEAARHADVAVVAVGDLAGLFGTGTSGEGCDSEDLDLPGLQGELVEAVLATGTPTVLLLVSGRPYALGAYASRCRAVVAAFMPGAEGAAAIAGVLTGRLNPSGHLPVAIPSGRGGQPGTYLAAPLGWFSEGVSNLDPRPLYPFGHGLSYTSFELGDLTTDATEVDVAGTVRLSVRLTNTGPRSGAEVVQVYATDPAASVVRPLKQLVGYAKVTLDAGESAQLDVSLHTDLFSFTGLDYTRVVEPGDIVLSVGTSSEDRPLQATVRLTGRTRVVSEGRVLTSEVTVRKG